MKRNFFANIRKLPAKAQKTDIDLAGKTSDKGKQMQFRLNSKLLSLGSNYQIRNDKDELAYVVRGKILSFGHDLTLETAQGVEVARIKQRLMNFMPTFELFLGEKSYATISKKLAWFKKRFLLDIPGPNDYEIEGNFWNYEYEFRRQQGVVATVSRKVLSITGVYGVDIAKGEDPISILAAVVVIDLCNRSEGAAAAQ